MEEDAADLLAEYESVLDECVAANLTDHWLNGLLLMQQIYAARKMYDDCDWLTAERLSFRALRAAAAYEKRKRRTTDPVDSWRGLKARALYLAGSVMWLRDDREPTAAELAEALGTWELELCLASEDGRHMQMLRSATPCLLKAVLRKAESEVAGLEVRLTALTRRQPSEAPSEMVNALAVAWQRNDIHGCQRILQQLVGYVDCRVLGPPELDSSGQLVSLISYDIYLRTEGGGICTTCSCCTYSSEPVKPRKQKPRPEPGSLNHRS